MFVCSWFVFVGGLLRVCCCRVVLVVFVVFVCCWCMFVLFVSFVCCVCVCCACVFVCCCLCVVVLFRVDVFGGVVCVYLLLVIG